MATRFMAHCLGCDGLVEWQAHHVTAPDAAAIVLSDGETVLVLCDGCQDSAANLRAAGLPFHYVVFPRAVARMSETVLDLDDGAAEVEGAALFVSIYRGLMSDAGGLHAVGS